MIISIQKVENSYDVMLDFSINYNSSMILTISSYVNNSLKYQKPGRLKTGSGDSDSNVGLSYFDTIYFIVVTMSTVNH